MRYTEFLIYFFHISIIFINEAYLKKYISKNENLHKNSILLSKQAIFYGTW